jgi:peptidoglycan/LPS O-acetylase OafA/YrhL
MSITYRKEIDGLRAIAVFSVIANHINLSGFNGGFIGVDIFFVISGFLIFQIIYKEKINNQFSFVKFYERRARRILPALFFMAVITSLASYFVLLPKDLKYFGKSLVAVALMCSNMVFPGQSGYFDPDSNLRPLLHTWSLGVEEQFYLLFPALVMLLWKHSIKFQSLIYLSIAIGSLAYADHEAYISPEVNFFMLSSRLWELLVGVMAAILFLSNKEWINTHKNIGSTFSLLGILSIFSAVLFFNENLPYPSIFTLLPTLGTLMVLIFASDQNFTGKYLSNKLFAWLGLSSYSAYLWHQPIFAIAKYQSSSDFPLWVQVLLIGFVLIVGHLSFIFIEQPTRHRVNISGPRLLKHVILGMVILITAGIAFYASNGFLVLYKESEANSHFQVLNAKEYIPNRFNALRNHSFDSKSTRPKVLIIGDSFAQDLTNAVFESDIHTEVQLSTFYISSRCGNLYIDTGYRLLQAPINRYQCPSESPYISDKNLMTLLEEADIIWLASSWKISQASRIKESVENISKKYSAKVFVFSTKDFGEMRLGYWMRQDHTDRASIRNITSIESNEVNKLLRNSLTKRVFVDISNIFCSESGSCLIFDSNGNLLTNDGRHLTQFGAQLLGSQLQDKHRVIFSITNGKSVH